MTRIDTERIGPDVNERGQPLGRAASLPSDSDCTTRLLANAYFTEMGVRVAVGTRPFRTGLPTVTPINRVTGAIWEAAG